jgi:hypothetical protein
VSRIYQRRKTFLRSQNIEKFFFNALQSHLRILLSNNVSIVKIRETHTLTTYYFLDTFITDTSNKSNMYVFLKVLHISKLIQSDHLKNKSSLLWSLWYSMGLERIIRIMGQCILKDRCKDYSITIFYPNFGVFTVINKLFTGHFSMRVLSNI